MSKTAFHAGILSPALRQWCGKSLCPKLPHLFGNPALMVWPPHTCCVWPCQVPKKYFCTVPSIISIRHLPPQMKYHGLNEEKTHLGKNNLSIELSEVNVWLVWILTTKGKSLTRVETCQKKAFHVLTVCYVNSLFRFNLSNSFKSMDIYTFPFNLFHIETLIVHLYLNDVVVI